jgi:ribosomal protein S18 acetylase RimI-like enzyme
VNTLHWFWRCSAADTKSKLVAGQRCAKPVYEIVDRKGFVRPTEEILRMAEPGICVRCAMSDDAEDLSAFAAAVFPLGGPSGADPRDLAHYIATELTAECFCTLIEDPNAMLFVAEIADRICGYALALRSSPHPQIEGVAPAELRKLYVAPAHHGRGVAGELMRQALASLGRDRLTVVWLSVYSENPRAIAFYKKWGFHVAGTQEFLVGADRQKDFLMRREPPLAPQERA